MQTIRNLILCISIFILSAFISGCGIIDYFYLPPAEDTVQELYESATDYMRDKEYYKASQNFTKIVDNFPFSPYAIKAELALGDALYLNKRYQGAADAYLDFEEKHPRNEAMPYVLYQIASSLQNTFISVDRPALELKTAISYYERLIQTYPDTEYAQKAPEQIYECRKRLAEREIYIADVFWNMNNYGAAWKRFGYVYDNYQDMPELAKYAEDKAKLAFIKYKENSTAETRREVEGSWRDYFEWL